MFTIFLEKEKKSAKNYFKVNRSSVCVRFPVFFFVFPSFSKEKLKENFALLYALRKKKKRAGIVNNYWRGTKKFFQWTDF